MVTHGTEDAVAEGRPAPSVASRLAQKTTPPAPHGVAAQISAYSDGACSAARQEQPRSRLQHPLFCQGGAGLTDHEVVEHPNLHQTQGLLQPSRDGQIARAGFADPTGMIMEQ